MFTRISICFFLRRLFAIEETWGRFLFVMIHFIWISNLALVVGILFLCRPLQKVWRPSVPGICWPPQTFINIGYWQGGEWYNSKHARLYGWTDIGKSYFDILRFNTRSSADCLLVECPNQAPDQSRNLYNHGNGCIVCLLLAANHWLPLTTYRSTAMCALIRTVLLGALADQDLTCMFYYQSDPTMMDRRIID